MRDSFRGASNLTQVQFGNSVEYLGIRAFENTPNLERIITSGIENSLPASITSVPDNLFYRSGIREVILHSNITRIGTNAFGWNTSLTSVTIERPSWSVGGITTLGTNAFSNANANLRIYVPYCSLAAYRAAWGEVSDRVFSISTDYVKQLLFEGELSRHNSRIDIALPGNSSYFSGKYFKIVIDNSSVFGFGGISTFTTGGSTGAAVGIDLGGGSSFWFNVSSFAWHGSVQIVSPLGTNWSANVRVWVLSDENLLFSGVVDRDNNLAEFSLPGNCDFFAGRYFRIVIDNSNIFYFSYISQFNTGGSQGCMVSLYIGNESSLLFVVLHSDLPQGSVSIYSPHSFHWYARVQIWLVPLS